MTNRHTSIDNTPMPHGEVTRIERDLGFGWIVDDAGMDWFFKREDVVGDGFDRLQPDDRVIFTHRWTPSGPRAGEITLEYPQQTD